ncbi:MAG TPA: PAS domain-containing sensor histidine kinase [Ruminiclostridium sp.]
MGHNFNNKIVESNLYSRDSIITDVNKEFTDCTGFTTDELLGKSLKIIEQQKQQIEQLKYEVEQKNTQLISILENLSEGVMVSDNKGKYIMMNPEAKRLVYQSSHVIDAGDSSRNTHYFDIEGNDIPFENLPEIRALRGESIKNAKMFVRHPNKEYFMEVSSTPSYAANGDLSMVVSCFHEITETIQQSRKILEQKKQLEAIIENIADGISIFDNKGKYILFNKSAREMSPVYSENTYKVGDRNNQCELYDIDGEKIDSENIPARRVLRGEKFKNMRMAIKFSHKTSQIDVSGTPIYDNEGNFSIGVLCSRDMTDNFKYENILKDKNKFLDRLLDNFELPVVRLSCTDLKILEINQKAFYMLKTFLPHIESAVKIKGTKITDMVTPFNETEYFQKINEVIKEKKTKYLNRKVHLINGNEVYWNVIFEPMLEVNDEIKEILILIIDVTDEIKSNIVMGKAMKSQEEFFANISHELRTPLNVIASTIQLLKMYYSDESLNNRKESIIKYIDSMKKNCYRLSKLINNIVDSSKIEAGFFELNLLNHNIVEVVEEIVISVTNFTDSKGLNIIFDTDSEEKIIACDPEKIERIILNLISNAIKFSNHGGEIFVDIKDKSEFVEISVKDNGIGIEEKYLDMIFDRFKQVDKSLTRNAEGTGIGLSLVKSIVELHGGSISVESEYGKGSKFIVVLPTREVMQQNMIFSSNIRDNSEIIQVELSDV